MMRYVDSVIELMHFCAEQAIQFNSIQSNSHAFLTQNLQTKRKILHFIRRENETAAKNFVPRLRHSCFKFISCRFQV